MFKQLLSPRSRPRASRQRRRTACRCAAFVLLCQAAAQAQAGAGPTPNGATPAVPVAARALISEWRSFGPHGGEDSFVEIANPGDEPLDVSHWSLQFLNEQRQLVTASFPAEIEIPARGHLLFAGRQYSLNAFVVGDVLLKERVMSGIRLCNARGDVVDAVGPHAVGAAAEAALPPAGTFAEGRGLASRAVADSQTVFKDAAQFSWVRKTSRAGLRDTQDNQADFVLVSVDGTLLGAPARLGAPGPQNLASTQLAVPALPETAVQQRADAGQKTPATRVAAGGAADHPLAAPRVRGLTPLRDTRASSENAHFGTLMLRCRFVNQTAKRLSLFRLHVIDITSGPDAASIADVRLLPASPVKAEAALKAGAARSDLPIVNAVLDEPPVQKSGGALNSSVTLHASLPDAIAPGQAVELRFVLGVMRRGHYRLVLDGGGFSCAFDGQTDEASSNPPATDASWRIARRSSRQGQSDMVLAGQGGTTGSRVGGTGGSSGGSGSEQPVSATVVFEGSTLDNTDETPSLPAKPPSAPTPS